MLPLATDPTPFFDYATAQRIANVAGTPAYVYDQRFLEAQARQALDFPAAFGLTVRYAMKASPNAAILRIFHGLGLHVDVSSGPEVHRALAAGIPASHMSLSSQELPSDFAELRRQGLHINACSLHQLERYGQVFPGGEIGLRFNPGAGSGGNNRTNVGGPSSSFGIWHERLPEIRDILARHRLRPVRIHTHIGSGSDPDVWKKVAHLTLDLVAQFPEVTTMNLGGGFKVARVAGETPTCLTDIGTPVAQAVKEFAATTGRHLHLEIEPGTFLVANGGALLARVQDVAHTGTQGYQFLKLDGGMTEVLRPSLYGSQHPIFLLQAPEIGPRPLRETVVVGHCCESGDLLTPAPGEPELLATRTLPVAEIGDFCYLGGAGAYCSAMCTKNYNSFPEAPEVLLDRTGHPQLIRRRQPLHEIWKNEIRLD